MSPKTASLHDDFPGHNIDIEANSSPGGGCIILYRQQTSAEGFRNWRIGGNCMSAAIEVLRLVIKSQKRD